MMEVSFAWTTGALLAGLKDVTRRNWSDGHAERIRRSGVCWALDKDRRAGGQRIGKIQVLRVEREPIQNLLDDPVYGYHEIGREGGCWTRLDDFVAIFRRRKVEAPYRVEFKWLGAVCDNGQKPKSAGAEQLTLEGIEGKTGADATVGDQDGEDLGYA